VAIYLIAAHTDPVNLARLVSRLPEESEVHVHVDAKVSDSDIASWRQMMRADVVFVERRHRVTWSGFGMVRAELELLRSALAKKPKDHEHLVLLSGADYPIRPVSEFEDYLRTVPHRQHIRAFAIPESESRYFRQVERYWWMDQLVPGRILDKAVRRLMNEVFGRALGRLRGRPPLVPCQGLTWWAITADCAHHVLEEVTHSIELVRFFSHTWCPDEKFVHSIVYGSPFAKETRCGEIERYRGPGQWRLTNFHLIHPSLTKYYALDDIDEVAMSDAYFVRKVRTGHSDHLLDWLDRNRLSTTTREVVAV
jgi:hypothetical protein